MAEREDVSMTVGPWTDRVEFAEDGTAHVPGTVVFEAPLTPGGKVSESGMVRVNDVLARLYKSRKTGGSAVSFDDREEVIDGWFRVSGDFDAEMVAMALVEAGFNAHPVHVVFGHAVHGNPLYGTPLYGTPLYGTPLYGTPLYGTPLYGTPLYGTPLYGTPLYGTPTQSPVAVPQLRSSGRRRSSARPETPTGRLAPPKTERAARVAILDTGWIEGANAHLDGMRQPQVLDMELLGAIAMPLARFDEPDSDGDRYLDPIAGHATFIAGIIEQNAPYTELTIAPVLTPFGDGREDDIARTLQYLARLRRRPHVVNLSFGTYMFDAPGMQKLGKVGLLQTAIRRLQEKGTVVVASAGNDASFAPNYPAAFDDVVSVGAIDSRGLPAPFTNYGDWVRACAVGVDLTSIFFDDLGIPEHEFFDQHPREFEGWARWDGTSFAAPVVVAAFAREIAQRAQMGVRAPSTRSQAASLIEAVLGPKDSPERLPMLGVMVE
jgi:hypothetical protein